MGVLLALTLALGACEAGSPFTPGYVPPPGEGNSGTSGGGGTSAGVLIVGTWEAVVVTSLPDNDYVTTKTTWIFRSTGVCLQTISTLQFSEGVTRTTTSACTYSLAQGFVVVLYEGSTLPVSYEFSFPVNNTDQLVLAGITYERVI